MAATCAFVHGVSARDRAETAQAVHGELVGGRVGFVLRKAEVGLMLGSNWLGETLFWQTGMALLLEPAFFVGKAAFLIDSGGEADMEAAHLTAPIVGTRRGLVSIVAAGQRRCVCAKFWPGSPKPAAIRSQ